VYSPIDSPIDEILTRARAARIEKARRHLKHFVREAWHVLEPNTTLEWSWHIECIADHVQWMLEQWMGRRPYQVSTLVVNVPPGSMKSLILNVFAPAWMWLPCNAPHWTLLTISGSDSVVTRDADKMRDLIKSPWYRESFNIPWEIRPDADATKSFKNTKRGWRKSQTQQARVTGDRFDAIFLDDPNDIKDISAVKLEQVKQTWYAAGNRLNDMRRAIRIGIQQRTHEDDWSGHVLEEKKDPELKIEHLCIPMEYLPPGAVDSDGKALKCACGDAECDTTLGKNDPRTEDGEVLHPERNTPEVLAAEMKRLGTLGTAGQLNQRPSPLGGGMFKDSFWRAFDELPRDRRGYLLTEQITMSVDATFGGKNRKTGEAKGSSRVAIMVVARRKSTRYVLDLVVGKMTYSETKRAIKAMYEKWIDPTTGRYMITKTIIEEKANGAAILEELGDDIPGMVADSPDTDKVSRANAVHPQCEAGNVALLRDAPWVDEFKHELGTFPKGKYDDIVDALTQVLLDMSDATGLAKAKALCQL
jgi:predicted phage terminase large subunit-like protein